MWNIKGEGEKVERTARMVADSCTDDRMKMVCLKPLSSIILRTDPNTLKQSVHRIKIKIKKQQVNTS